jgi:hypothetical protein
MFFYKDSSQARNDDDVSLRTWFAISDSGSSLEWQITRECLETRKCSKWLCTFPTMGLVVFFSFDEGSGGDSELLNNFFCSFVLMTIEVSYLFYESWSISTSNSLWCKSRRTSVTEISLGLMSPLSVFDSMGAITFFTIHWLFLWDKVLLVLSYIKIIRDSKMYFYKDKGQIFFDSLG